MARITWKCFLLLAMLLLASCAAKNVNQNVDLTRLTGTGLVFASVSTSPEGGEGPIATFRFKRGGFVKSREEQTTGRHLKPSELDGDYGRLIIVELPVGANSLKSWMLTDGAAQYIPASRVPEIAFIVEPGKALYLGNLHMNLTMAANDMNEQAISDLLPEIRDRRERDLVLFKSRYPQVAETDIIARQPFLGTWSQKNVALSP